MSVVCGTAGTNNTKQPCPVTNGTAVPAIRPVAVPQIVSLQGGQILIGNESAPQPTQIKVISEYDTLKGVYRLCLFQEVLKGC